MPSTDHPKPPPLREGPDLKNLPGFRHLDAARTPPRPTHDPMDFLAGATVMAAVCGLSALSLPGPYAAVAVLLALVLLAVFCRHERDRADDLRADAKEDSR